MNSTALTIGYVNMTVKKAPGAEQIDLQNLTATWTGPGGTETLVHDDVTTDADAAQFSVKAFKDADDSVPVVNSPDDRLIIVFDLLKWNGSAYGSSGGVNNASDIDGDANINRIGEGSSVTIQMTTKSGGQTTVRLTVPESLSGESSVQL